jgi:hypothetical protein
MRLAKSVTVGGRQIEMAVPPSGLVVHEHLGILSHESVSGQVIHCTAKPEIPLYETRATITPGGDYLLMFPEGGHYGHAGTKVNDMLAYRSSDRGQTWTGPTVAFDIDYNQHGFVPLIPRRRGRRSTRIYAFGTQPIWGLYTREHGLHENAPIGYRTSDDDGHTWSEVRIIRPENDAGFRGMSVMRMCETDDGTWLLGSHEGDWSYSPLQTRQYVLRSEDQGQTWQVLPRSRHGGWGVLQYGRMDEGRPIHLGGGRVLMLTRTPEGHLWELRSNDDGRTWSDPRPTALVHPDAPPMLCHLSDGETLVAFHHNRHSVSFDTYTGLGSNPEAFKDRSEIWVSVSTDEGQTWSEPRFVFANALAETLANDFRNYQCSYVDVFADSDQLHLFVPHRWRQVLHLSFSEQCLERFPTREELAL